MLWRRFVRLEGGMPSQSQRPSTPPIAASAPHLPSLPPLVRYFDDFEDRYRTISDLDASDSWELTYDGKTLALHFDRLAGWHRLFTKLAFADLIVRRSPATAVAYAGALGVIAVELQNEIIEAIVLRTPLDFLDLWVSQFRSRLRPDQMRAVRHLARTACRMNIGHWALSDISLIRSLPGASIDKYASVRDGSAFVGLDAQSKLVEFIDHQAAAAGAGRAASQEIAEACILALSFQYGLRPGQIARVAWEDVKFFESGAVHVAVQQLKQRGHAHRAAVPAPCRQHAGRRRQSSERLDEGSLQGDGLGHR